MYDIAMLGRPMNAVLPLFLVAIGAVCAGVDPRSEWRLPVALAVVVLIHSATTMWNDVEDVAIDKRNHVVTLLTRGFVTKKIVVRVVIGQLLLAAIGLMFFAPLAWLAATLLIILGWAYNVPPLRFSRRPIASIVVLALSYGFLPLLLGASLGHVDGSIVLLGLFWSLSRGSLSILKDYKDAVGDAASNKRTFLLTFGHSQVRRISMIGAAIGNAGVVAILLTDVLRGELILAGITACAALLGIIGWRTRLYVLASYKELNVLFHQCLAIQLGIEGAMVLWLIMPFIS